MLRVLLVAVLLTVAGAGTTNTQQLALAELENRARADSNDPVAHYNLAAGLVGKRRYEDAVHSLRQAIAIDPHYAPALLLLSRVLAARDTRGPLAVLSDGRRITFVRLVEDREITRLARRAFLLDPLLEVEPPSREWLPAKWRGTLSQALRNYDREEWTQAIAGLQSVIDRTVKPGDSSGVPPVALWFRARAAIRVGDYDGAIAHMRWLLAQQLEEDSTSAERRWNPFLGQELRYVLAFVYQQASRWDDATRLYQELLEQNLGLDLAHSHLAEVYESQGRWPEAIQERRRAIDANPDDLGLTFDLGSTLVYAGQYAEAEETLARFAEAHPRESRAHYLLGYTRMRLGKTGPAREALTRYLALAPSRYGEQINDAKLRLAALGPAETR